MSAGTYTVTVTATDEYGKTGTASETITVLTNPATGTTYWVSKSGSNSNSGSEASPWLTLQYAVNKLAPRVTPLTWKPGLMPDSTCRHRVLATQAIGSRFRVLQEQRPVKLLSIDRLPLMAVNVVVILVTMAA